MQSYCKYRQIRTFNKKSNTILIKLNQIGAITEQFELIKLAKKNNLELCIDQEKQKILQ